MQTFYSVYLFNRCKKMMQRKGYSIQTYVKDECGVIKVEWRKT